MTALSFHAPWRRMPLGVIVGTSVAAWLVAWFAEAPLADWISFSMLRLATDEPANRVELLRHNLTSFGTIYNTKAAAAT